MANTRDKVYDYGYFNDAGVEHIVSLTTSVAAAGGFVAATTPGEPYLPLFSKMRHIGIYEPVSGQRHQIPVALLSNTLFLNGGTVAFGGETCNVVGKTGEEWRLSSTTL